MKLEIPDVVSEDMVEELRKLNLTVGTTVDVWPVGSPALVWDGKDMGMGRFSADTSRYQNWNIRIRRNRSGTRWERRNSDHKPCQ